jgi:hypothetical protein
MIAVDAVLIGNYMQKLERPDSQRKGETWRQLVVGLRSSVLKRKTSV